MNIRLWMSVAILCMDVSVGAMQDQPQVSLITQNLPQTIAKNAEHVPAGGIIRVGSPHAGNPIVTQALTEAKKRGVKVALTTKQGSLVARQKRKFEEEGIEVQEVPNFHAKYVLMSPSDNVKGMEKGFAYVGSDNMSTISSRQIDPILGTVKNNGHREAGVGMVNDASLKDLYFFTERLKKPMDPQDKQVLNVTPKKQKIVHSGQHDLTATRAQRLKTMQNVSGPSQVTMTTMTCDFDPDTLKILKEATFTRNLLIDNNALKKKPSRDQLQELNDAGVNVRVYNSENGKKYLASVNKTTKKTIDQLQHAKLLIRKSENQPEKDLVVVSTGNWTTDAKNQINMDVYHPNNPALLRQTTTFIEKLKQRSEPWDDNYHGKGKSVEDL